MFVILLCWLRVSFRRNVVTVVSDASRVTKRVNPSSLLVILSEDPPISLLDSIRDTEVIEQPLVAVASIRMCLKAIALLLARSSLTLGAPVA
jgi:hypothetical protein